MTLEAVRDTILVKRLRTAQTKGGIRGEVLSVGPFCPITTAVGEKIVFHGQFAEEVAKGVLVVESPAFSVYGIETRVVDDDAEWHVCLADSVFEDIYIEGEGPSVTCPTCQQLTVLRAQIALQMQGVDTGILRGKQGGSLGYSLDEFMSKPRSKDEIADAGMGLDDEMLQKGFKRFRK